MSERSPIKVSVIGAGRIGSLTAYTIAGRRLADEIVLVDINEPFVRGQSEDIIHSLAMRSSIMVSAGTWADVAGSGIVIITSGAPRTAATKDRTELLQTNISIVRSVAGNLRNVAGGALLLTVSNPSDIMNYVMQNAAGIPKEKALGFGNLLDSARLRHLISEKLGVKVTDIGGAYVVGEHGDAMVPLFSSVKIRGKIHAFSDAQKSEITAQLRGSARNLISLKGATEFGPASCIADMVEAIAKDTCEVMPVSLVRDGVSIGALARIEKSGAEPVEMKMDERERKEFEAAQEKLREIVSSIDAEDL